MVTIFFRGGLGNQMFQYAFGLELAKKNNTELVLDTVVVRDRFPRRNFTYRTFDLSEVFTVEPRLTMLSRYANTLPIPGLWLGLDLLSVAVRNFFGRVTVLRQKEHAFFDPAILNVRGNILLVGRWESEKYFADVAHDIRAAFKFRYSLAGDAEKIAEEIKKTNSISLHVRRGDFVKFEKVTKAMGEIGAPYYEGAIAYIASHVKDPHFFVFSNDVAWAKDNIKTGLPTTFLDGGSAGPKDAFHLELMSLCEHHIVANSTFSWWGAWLDPRPNKIVVAPKIWQAAAMGQDTVPDSWVRL